jgi:hypothetical protein
MALRKGWSIYPVYRGCTTVQGYTTMYQGSSGPGFDRMRDAVAWVTEDGASFEESLLAQHSVEVRRALGSTTKYRAYCNCGWFTPTKRSSPEDALADGEGHVRAAGACRVRR